MRRGGHPDDRRAGAKRIFEVLGVILPGEHLSGAAKAAFGSLEEGVEWLNARSAELWRGDAEELAQTLEEKVAELAPRGRSGTRATASTNTASAYAATRSAGTACP